MTITFTNEAFAAVLDLDQWVVVALVESWMQERGMDFMGNSPKLTIPKSPGVPSVYHPAFNAVEHRQSLCNYIVASVNRAGPGPERKHAVRPESR